jgi:hypothetical protein
VGPQSVYNAYSLEPLYTQYGDSLELYDRVHDGDTASQSAIDDQLKVFELTLSEF